MQNPYEIRSVRNGLLPRRIRNFMETESASGVVMILFALLAIAAANSPFASLYHQGVNAPITFGFQENTVTHSLKDWVKDVLMVLFFLVIGLELKREMCEGFLSKRDQIMLPLLAAVGGMVVPALIYYALNYQSPNTLVGWAIPSATDIAFALAMLTLLGKGMPPSIRIFLLAVAIFDDLGAIIIITAFYSTGFALTPMLAALGGIAALILLNRMRMDMITLYMLVGIFLWFCFYFSGVHTTLAGVLVGFAIPMRSAAQPRYSPLGSCIHFLHPWVSFMVLPIFALTSAGVNVREIEAASLLAPLPLGIALGLFVGKQLGIFGASWLLIRTGLASMPEGSSWRHLYAVSVIAGIGFTMSLFIGMLAFPDPQMQEMVKLGVMTGSLLCVGWGAVVLRLVRN